MTDSQWKNEVEGLLPEGTPAGQARAVMHDGRLITVGAGAGTGKTWVLSTRFARLLLSDAECLPQSILTLTFTEAAAREMQERIRKRVFDLAAERPESEQLRWQSVKEGFDEAWISTIHSFASRMIRESGLALDLDPQSAIVAPPQEEAFWGAWERALESLELSSFVSLYGGKDLYETALRLEADTVFIAALEKWPPAVLRDLVRDVIELHSMLGNTRETLLAWANDAERSEAKRDGRADAALEAVRDLLSSRWREAWHQWREVFSLFHGEILEARDEAAKKAATAKTESPVFALAKLMERWQELEKGVSGPSVEEQRLFYLDLCGLSSNNARIYKLLAEHLGRTVSDWRRAQAKWKILSEIPPDFSLPPAEQSLRSVLLRLSVLAWAAWDGMKRRRGLLSFSDMIYFAAQSIHGDSRKKDFKHVLVDEFQDTDPLQDGMIRALCGKEDAALFVVGDPKQAIYGFRHADLTLFADYMLQSREANADIVLDVSFRTRSALLAPINSLFAHIWKEGLGAGARMGSLKFEPLSAPPSPERDVATVPPFSLFLGIRRGREDKDAPKRMIKALAGTFARYVAEGRTIWDKASRCLRPISWRDCAILVPTRSAYGRLETAFEEEGVPLVLEKNMNYFTRGEVSDVINVLRAAAFSEDEAALSGWLSSPFSGASQREVRDCFKAHSWAVRADSSALLRDVVREYLPSAAERLNYLRHLGNLKGPSVLLSHLLEDRTWLSAFDEGQHLRIVANINRAVGMARQYETGLSPSLAGCAQWLDTALRADSAAEEPDWSEEDTDAVRVTTVHASKGLEFPVVAILGMERGLKGPPAATVAASKNMGVALSDVPDMMSPRHQDDGAKPLSLPWERALSFQGELEESSRLFYVAATRAQDALILCGIADENAKGERNARSDSWLEWTLDWLGGETDCDWRDMEGPPLIRIDDTPVAERERPSVEKIDAGTLRDPLHLPGSGEVTLSSFSATSFALFEWCPHAWRRRHRQGLDLRWEIPEEDADTVGGSELGLIAHWLLARWDMKQESLVPLLEDEGLVRRLPAELRDTWRKAKNRDALQTWLTSFSLSDEGRRLAAAVCSGNLRREGAFCANLGKLRLTGATDVLWDTEEDGEKGYWHVRDYKITLSDNAPEELYRSQLAFYALVVELLAEEQGLPFNGVDVGLIFLREGGRLGETRFFPRAGEWERMRGTLIDTARTAAQGPWIPVREHCARCPWRLGCSEGKISGTDRRRK